MRARELRRLWHILLSTPQARLDNALREHPELAMYMQLYSMSKQMGALPEAGGLLDQRADIYQAFAVLAAAEVEAVR